MKSAIEIMSTEPWCELVCKKISPLHWEDLRQELFLLIATDLTEKAQKALDNGYFEFFYIRCASNLAGSGGRIGKMNQGGEEIDLYDFLDEETDYEQRSRKEADVQEKLDAIYKVQSEQEWYENKLGEMYLSGMSRRKINRVTKISLAEVSRVINQFRRQCWDEYQ